MKNNRLIKWCTANNTKIYWSSFTAVFLFCITIIGLFCIKFQSEIENVFWWLLLTSTLISIIAGLSSLFIRLPTTKVLEETKCDDDDILINDLIVSLKKELDKSKYQEVITIGSILSNPLFTIGKYELRLDIGILVKKAAIAQYAILKDNKYKECEMIQLIDSIGWMKVELGKVNEGRTDIESGRKIAEKLNSNKGKFYEAKVYRHFGAIERRNHNWQKALDYNDISLEKANEITDDQLKTEAIAAAHYARAFVFKEQSNYENALDFLDKSIFEFEKLTDNDKKTMKVCMVSEAKARFLFYSKQNENNYDVISTAKRLFDETLSVAEHNSMRLEMIRCYIGLAECNLHFTINNPIEAKQYIEKAKNVKIKCDDDQKRIRDIERKIKDIERGHS